MNLSDDRYFFMGNHHGYSFNRKLCFQARDTLFDCIDDPKVGAGNKFRCPDQLYAYEMWCPTDFRRMHSQQRRKEKIDAQIYTDDFVQAINIDKQTNKTGHYYLV
jgi:hypothetical protein